MTSSPLYSAPTPFPWRIALGVLLLSIVIYFPAFTAGYIWDDPDYIINNKNLRDFEGLTRTWLRPFSLPQWYPVVHTTFWIEYQLWKLWSPGYHVVNIVLHAIGAVALMWVLLKLGFSRTVAALGALIWSVHPVQVESVAWVTERKNTLSALFYFLAMGLLLCWEERRGGGKAAWRWWAGALVLFLLALGSKTVTASLPAAWLLIRYWKAGRIDLKRDVLPILPFFLIGFAAGQFTAWMEKNHVGADGLEWSYGKVDRTLIAGRAVWFYLYKLALPVQLAFIYERWEIDPRALWQWIFPVAAVGLGVALFVLRHRIGRGPVVAYAFFVGTLFPALGFFNVYPHRYSFVADHFQHIASVSPLLVAAVVMARWPKAVVVAVVGVLSVLTAAQSSVYRDELTLWRDSLRKAPGSWMGYANVALIYREKTNEVPDAKARVLENLQIARYLAPDNAETNCVLGDVYAQRGYPKQARWYLEHAIRCDPKYAPSYSALGEVEMSEGNLAAAEKLFRDALALQPAFPKARSNLAKVLLKQGHREEAAREFAAVISIDATRFEDRLALARLLRGWGKDTASTERLTYAASHYNEAMKLKPEDAQVRLEFGETLLLLGDRARGAPLLESAARLDPTLEPQVRALLP